MRSLSGWLLGENHGWCAALAHTGVEMKGVQKGSPVWVGVDRGRCTFDGYQRKAVGNGACQGLACRRLYSTKMTTKSHNSVKQITLPTSSHFT